MGDGTGRTLCGRWFTFWLPVERSVGVNVCAVCLRRKAEAMRAIRETKEAASGEARGTEEAV
jgi:hypothetical protein